MSVKPTKEEFEKMVISALVKVVEIPIAENHDGQTMKVKVFWLCPRCLEKRGEIFRTKSFDGSRRAIVDGWINPCGHIDSYADIRLEASINNLNT